MPSVGAQAVPSPAPLPQAMAPTFLPKPWARGVSQRHKVLLKHLFIPTSSAQQPTPCPLSLQPHQHQPLIWGWVASAWGRTGKGAAPFCIRGISDH